MRFRRRRYIVSSGVQWRFSLIFITAVLMGGLAATALFNIMAVKRLEEIQWSVFMTAQSTGEVLRPLFTYVTIFSLVFTFALLMITLAWMLKKLNGPLYRIVKDLKLIRAGNFSTDIILRRKDEFADVSVALNDMLAKMRQKFSEYKDGYDEISQALVDLEIAHAKGLPVNKDADRITGLVQHLQNQLSQPGSREA